MRKDVKFIINENGNLVSAAENTEKEVLLQHLKEIQRFEPEAKMVDGSDLIDASLSIDAQIEKVLTLAQMSAESNCDGKKVEIEIIWGDWKHDHEWADALMRIVFDAKKISEDVTEEDGSDTYSSIHTYELK